MWDRGKFSVVVLVLQIIFIILFAVMVKYGHDSDGSLPAHGKSVPQGGDDPEKNSVHGYYPLFQDVHVMMFIGFGFLMTFLKRYGQSAVGLNFLLTALVLQWATLMQGIHANNYKLPIEVGIGNLLGADFSAAAVLISFGAVLGKTSPLQLVIMSMIEIAIFAANEHLGLHTFKAVDVGGSMFVHVFGAYFGLGVSVMLFKRPQTENDKNGSNYNSDIFAMIGTLFLWMFWPSFNSALAAGDARHRAIINTYYSLSACVLSAFAFSALVNKEKFDMVHIQNATLAGGVAVGTAADMMVEPYGAMLIGFFAGLLSVIGYRYIQPCLEKLRIHDTCGVHNLHGMPGVMAGCVGALVAFLASEDNYGKSLYKIFPARIPDKNTTLYEEIEMSLGEVDPNYGRSSKEQCLYQLIALGVTFVIAIAGGLITGAVMKLPIFSPLEEEDLYEDERNWELGEDDMEKNLKETNNVHYAQDNETTKV